MLVKHVYFVMFFFNELECVHCFVVINVVILFYYKAGFLCMYYDLSNVQVMCIVLMQCAMY